MKRILYFDWHSDASSFYRLLPLDYLRSDSFTVTRSSERDIHFSVISGYDVIIFLRPTSEYHMSAIQQCKDQGKIVIGDWDDDVLHLNRENPMYEIYEQDKGSAVKCLKLCDEVWVATEGIRQSFAIYSSSIHVIPNAHNDTIFPVKKKKPFSYNKMCMWRGGGSHEGDIYTKGITESIVNLINNNETWNFYWLGMRFKFIEMRVTKGNFYRNDGGSPIQFYRMMHDFNPCVFIYPLATNVFNKSKSLCSFIEATYSGAAVFGNKSLPEFNKEFIGEFSENILKTSMTELKKMNDKAWKFVQDHLLLSKVNELRLKRLNDLS